MSLDQIAIDLKVKLACQHEEICILKEKLITFDEIICQKNDLQCQINNLKQWMEDVKADDERMKNTLLNSLDIQTGKLKKVEVAECKMRLDIKGLNEVNECLTKKLRTLEEDEQRLIYEKKDLELCKNRALEELCCAKNKMKEMECIVESLTKSLKCKEEEYCHLRCEYDACKCECERLSEDCRNLNTDLESVKSDLMTAQCQAKQTEERLRHENETLSNEMEVKCQKLQVIEIEFNEARRIIANDKCNIKKLETLIVKLREAAEKDQCEMNMKIEKLKKEICIKDELACRMKTQLIELQRQNECLVTDIKMLKKQIQANECLLEKMKHSHAMLEQIRNNKYEQLEKEKNSLANDVKCQQKKIAELEHQTCCLEEKVKEQEINKCRSTCDPCLPPCDPCPTPCNPCPTPCNPCPPLCNPCPPLCNPCPPLCNPCPPPCDPCPPPCDPCQTSYTSCSPCLKSTKLCDNNSCNENKLLEELKQLYCDFEEIKENYNAFGVKKVCN